jgi:deoxyribodipyrimidine photo-lyase
VRTVPKIRVQDLNQAAVRADGEYVLYWMVAQRRVTWNFSLQHAIDCAEYLQKPLVIFEALRSGYEWASDRMHRFVIQGMADNAERLKTQPVTYLPYLEPASNAGKGLLEELAANACMVVTDDFPCFFIPHMQRAVARRLPVKLVAVDANGLLPLRAASQVYPTAYAFRRFLQKELQTHVVNLPVPDPFHGRNLRQLAALPETITQRWPTVRLEVLQQADVSQFPIDHAVGPAAFDGGTRAAEAALNEFMKRKLIRYGEDRNDPEDEVNSGLSPYLHFGHIGAHEIFSRIVQAEDWKPETLPPKGNGSREGWWGMSPSAEGFLDQVVTWRELGYNFCWQRSDYDKYSSLPEWAQATLQKHASDPRPNVYELDRFEAATTHDELWNAAQRQLVREGRMHNYLRMLWGKKILEWSPSPQEALETMIHLNNKYAVDGRNPNSYSGIFWTLGRYDRAWGPERPIFGTIRYMSSDNTVRKLNVKGYLARYGIKTRRQERLFEE